VGWIRSGRSITGIGPGRGRRDPLEAGTDLVTGVTFSGSIIRTGLATVNPALRNIRADPINASMDTR
jgi:hypothetical protein